MPVVTLPVLLAALSLAAPTAAAQDPTRPTDAGPAVPPGAAPGPAQPGAGPGDAPPSSTANGSGVTPPPDGAPAAGGQVPSGEAHGMVLRLDGGTEPIEKPLVAHIKPPRGELVDVELKDDGTAPDVNKDDGIWSGASYGVGDEYAVSVTVGTTVFTGGSISWAPDDAQRDLTMTLRNGMLTAETGASGTPPNGSPVADGSPAPGGAPGGTPGEPMTPPGGATPSGPASESADDATLYVAFGLGGLLLAVIGYLWYQRRGDASMELPDDVVRMPELGILGADTPAVSAGLSLWVAQPDAARDLVQPTLATLARHHRVLVAVPKHVAVPAVRGGPVYRIAAEDVRTIADAVADMVEHSGGPLSLLLMGEFWTGERIRKLAADLPEGVGGVVLAMVAPDVSLPTLHCARHGTGWCLRYGEIDILARETGEGLERSD